MKARRAGHRHRDRPDQRAAGADGGFDVKTVGDVIHEATSSSRRLATRTSSRSSTCGR
ncbi:adenosylhomocysteinase domain protein [Mycobacterium xenopi 3993]|nr:adenosylhomocysteinase domain protein [Mycobacterium xenopi 3993]